MFAGSTRRSNSNTHLSSIGNLTFAAGAGAFTLGGDPLTVSGAINNLSSNVQTINLPIILGASGQTWSGGTRGIVLNGGFNPANKSLTLADRITINSADDNLFLGGTISLGNAVTAAITLAGGSTLSNSGAWLGRVTGDDASVTVTGAGSHWSMSESLRLGTRGSIGRLSVLAGGSVRTGGNAYLGEPDIGRGAGVGLVRVGGENATWTVDGLLEVGNSGGARGTVTILDGGLVRATSVSVDTDSRIELLGGTLRLSPAAGKTVRDQTYRLAWIRGTVSFTSAMSLGGIQSLDADQTLHVANLLTVGTFDKLLLRGGVLDVGALTLSGGLIESAAGTDLRDMGGQAGAGMVSGALRGAAGQDIPLRWTAGTLAYTGDASLGSTLTLSPGRTLDVGNRLTIGAARTLVLDGGRLKAGAVTLSGGTIQSTGSIDIADTGNLTGHGLVLGRVHGGAGKTITASGGTLILGSTEQGAFDFAGTLNAGTRWVRLLSTTTAQLGAATTLGNGARLTTLNGASLGSGETLAFTGNATVEGDFHNDGAISGSSGALTFLDGVSGAGSFAGNIVFKGAHSPGNSAATVRFGGGKPIYDPGSVLTLEILGGAPGREHDQLVDMGVLSFYGTLHLVFGAGFSPADGQQFALFDFDQFRGSLAPDRIQVSGIDRQRLDFSQLGSTGTLAIAAPVPEPGHWAMLLAGLALTGWIARRRLSGAGIA